MLLPDQIIVVIHCASTWFMVGVIWLVQLGQYPLFAQVDPHSFPQYYHRYTQAISRVVLLPMFAELFTGVLLLKIYRGLDQSVLSWVGLGLIIMIWCSTFLLQVPQHKKLEKGFDRQAQKKLVVTNWIRTLLWTLRGILVLALLIQ